MIVEGDQLTRVQNKDLSDQEIKRVTLNAVKEPKRLWPKNPHTGVVKIPYLIDRGYSKFFSFHFHHFSYVLFYLSFDMRMKKYFGEKEFYLDFYFSNAAV